MTTFRIMTGSMLCLGLFVAEVATTQAQILQAQSSQPTGSVQQAGGDVLVDESAVKHVGWPKVTMPKIAMPKITMPKVTMPNMSTLFSPVSSGFKKVSAGAKKAWEGTKEMFSFGNANSPPKTIEPSATQPKQSLWKKLTTRSPEPAGPQTVGEWMSQPRLNP